MRSVFPLLALLMVLVPAPPAHAEFYHWVDRDGREYFTNDREKVPPEYRGSETEVRPDEKRVNVETEAPGPAAGEKSETAVAVHKDSHGRGKSYWHKRAALLRKDLRKLESKYNLLLKQERDQKKKKATANTKKAAVKRNKMKRALEKKIAAAKRRLEVDLPEEARKADAYPGWLRE